MPFHSCPYLGLSGDLGSVFMSPTTAHCCFVHEKAFSPDLEYQAQCCLTPQHVTCAVYSVPVTDPTTFLDHEIPLQTTDTHQDVLWTASLSPFIDDASQETDCPPEAFSDASAQRLTMNETASSMGSGRAIPKEDVSHLRPVTPSRAPVAIRSAQKVNFTPLILGFTALLALLALYVFFNPITVTTASDAAHNNLDGFVPPNATSNSLSSLPDQLLPPTIGDADHTSDWRSESRPTDQFKLTNNEEVDPRATVTPSPDNPGDGTASEVNYDVLSPQIPEAGAQPDSSPEDNGTSLLSLQEKLQQLTQSELSLPDQGQVSSAILEPPTDGRIIAIKPQLDNAGWWVSDDPERNHLGDSYLYAGKFENREYISAIRFNLREVARGAEILGATIELTGLRSDRLNTEAKAVWYLELIAESKFQGFSRAEFLTARSAAADHLITPAVSAAELDENGTLTWTLDEQMRHWLAREIIDGARSVIVRIQARVDQGETLFAWDTGQGAQSKANSPWLTLSVGRAPATPPPFSTQPFIVATHTSVPKNVITVVALNQTATAVAQTTGTFTPVPYDIFTPTPAPQNLATIQSVAVAKELPPIALPTATAIDAADATARAQYATAVALTTGTFTPVPTNYVTPQLILPSPIAQNAATTIARTDVAREQAILQTPTPLPYNAVIAEYVIATTLPQNSATEEARRVIGTAMAQTTGTATPLPWHVVVVSPTPTALPTLPPTFTPTPFIFKSDTFEPTPYPQAPDAEAIPDRVPDLLRGNILFKSDRINGKEEILYLRPSTGETFVVNLPWVHDVARRLLMTSSDGSKGAVITTINGEPHIRIVQYEGNQARELPNVDIVGYDVAWSPQSNRIAFVSEISGSDEIYIMGQDGSNPTAITNSPDYAVKHPTWWNGQIVFHSNQTGRYQLWVMNPDGSNPRVLHESNANDWAPIYVR